MSSKQKMVINVSMSNGKKSYSKALKIVTGFEGVEKASVGEKDKSEIEVVAEWGVDPIKVVTSLRKKMEKTSFIGCFVGKCRRTRAHARLVSLTPTDGKKDEKKDEEKAYVWSMPHYVPPPMPQYVEYRDPHHHCTIM